MFGKIVTIAIRILPICLAALCIKQAWEEEKKEEEKKEK